MRTRIMNKVNFCFSSKMVHKKVLSHTPSREEDEKRRNQKSMETLVKERREANPVKFWANKLGELCMCSMTTAQSIRI